ncbi:MAG: flagellar biosynthetic protein FliR [Betaproteobacteria bacterium]|nr:flagellar biosynthetic protein FliR [Betaproteobacteria bacterium]
MISVTTAQLHAWLAAYAWPLARILALIASAPVIGNPSVPASVKIGLGLLITVLVAPLVPSPAGIDPASAGGLLILAQQVLVGLAMGFAMHVVFHAAEMTGELAGLQMGLGFATLYDASVPGFIPIIGQYLGIVVSLAFLAVDGHLLLVAALAHSFQVLPLAPLSAPSGLRALAEWGGSIFSYGLALSLPLLAALLITNVALGVLTRAAPQLNIFAVGFPLTILIGILALALALPYFAPTLERLFIEGLTAMPRLAAALR